MNEKKIKVGKLVYCDQWPEEILTPVREVLDPLQWLVPSWCNEVYVRWGTRDSAAIDFSIDYDYRQASLTFHPQFLLWSAKDRVYPVIHDLLHGFSAVLADYARDTIRDLLPEDESPKFRKHVLRELTMRHEQWTQDLAFCLHEFMGANHLDFAQEQPPEAL